MDTVTNDNCTQAGPAPGVGSSDWLADARAAIATARKFADQHETQLGWFVLRDLKATKRAGMSDLAWSGHKYGVTLNELRWFIGALEDTFPANNPVSNSGA